MGSIFYFDGAFQSGYVNSISQVLTYVGLDNRDINLT